MAHILIVGASLGGLMTANRLLSQGHAVTVIEKSPGSLEGRGAGIVTHRALVEGLERCGMPAGTELGVAVPGRVALNAEGAVVAERKLPQVLTSWSFLYRLLRELLMRKSPQALRPGVSLLGLETSAEGIEAHTSEGAIQADLLIGADGIRSTVRHLVWPSVSPQYAGYIAWRGMADEASLSKGCREAVFERFAFGLPPGEQFLGYPVAGAGNRTEPGRRAWNFVWYRPAPAPEGLQHMLTDADGVLHEHGIAPNLVSWRHVAKMREDAQKLLAPPFAEIVQKTAQPFLQPIQDVISDEIHAGRVALIGDAAFVARPHVGMGVSKAMQDADALADAVALHGATPRALALYAEQRLAAGQAVVGRARSLGAYMQASGQGQAHEQQRDADTVLRETAIDLDPIPQIQAGTRPAPSAAGVQPCTST